MKQDWQIKKLGEVCDMYQPKTISTKEMSENGLYPVFGANGIIGKYDKYNHEEPQLLITCRGATCGSVNISEQKSWINGNAMVIKPKDDTIDLKFLQYLFLGGIDFSRVITGSAQPQITRQSLNPVEMSYPSLSEQKKIVEVLDQAFAGIEQSRQNTKQNLKNAKEIFESYLQGVFENKGDDWEEKKLGEVCEVIAGQSPEGKFYNTVGEGLPFYQGKKEYGEKYIRDPKTWTKKVTKEAFAGDILMSVRAPVGPVNFATQKICIGRGLASIRAGDLIDKEFLFYFLNNKEKELEGNSGAVFNSINKDQIKQIPIPLPPLTEQKKIVQELDALKTQTEALEQIYTQKLNSLDELQKSLLQKAFAGELVK